MKRTEHITRLTLRWLPVLALLALVVGTWPARASVPAAQPAPVGVLGPEGMKGVSFVHTPTAPFGSDQATESLRRLAATGANWVAVVAPFRTTGAGATNFYRSGNDPDMGAVIRVINDAHSLGLKVMLQPIVLADDGVWNGLFQPTNVGEWFDNYRAMIRDYAQAAQASGVELFCVGTEFFTLTQGQDDQWRSVVATVRGSYGGKLTYSANWGDKKVPEYATIGWWDQLDYIGISAYFPLSWNNFYTDGLAAGWTQYQDPFGLNAQGQVFRWFDMINAAHLRWNKPVLFTKIGFGSYANSPGRWDVPPDPYLELSVQANGYDATMQVWGRVDWMRGIFWSPWYSAPNAGGPRDTGESPQNKPAEQILRQWYSGGR
jgi:hypothetical protein